MHELTLCNLFSMERYFTQPRHMGPGAGGNGGSLVLPKRGDWTDIVDLPGKVLPSLKSISGSEVGGRLGEQEERRVGELELASKN